MSNGSDSKKQNTITDYILLYTGFIIFSCSSIFGKLASGYNILSEGFIIFYGLELLVVFVYALLWQKILTRFELSVAYANRSVVTILSMLWGVLLFGEKVAWNTILGALAITCGIWMVVSENG